MKFLNSIAPVLLVFPLIAIASMEEDVTTTKTEFENGNDTTTTTDSLTQTKSTTSSTAIGNGDLDSAIGNSKTSMAREEEEAMIGTHTGAATTSGLSKTSAAEMTGTRDEEEITETSKLGTSVAVSAPPTSTTAEATKASEGELAEEKTTTAAISPTSFVSASKSEVPEMAASTSTGGPRLRDAIKHKYRKGKKAIKKTGKKIKSGIKEGYSSAKMKIVAGGAKYLVDYEIGLKTYAYILRTSEDRKWNKSDLDAIKNAITVALNPLKTYQQAQARFQNKQLGQSVKGFFRLLGNKPLNYTLRPEVWRKSRIDDAIFHRIDVQDVFSSRDNVLNLRPELSQDLMEVENRKITKANEYFAKKSDNWKFRKFIAYDLDWPGFESRYYDVVTKLLVADPGMAKEARHYLAIYLFTGDSQDFKYRSLMDNALKNRERRKAQANQTKQGTKTTQTMEATLKSMIEKAQKSGEEEKTGKAAMGMTATGVHKIVTTTVTVRRAQYVQRCPPGNSGATASSKLWLNSLLLPVVLFFLTVVL
jgi:hypothetical protein